MRMRGVGLVMTTSSWVYDSDCFRTDPFKSDLSVPFRGAMATPPDRSPHRSVLCTRRGLVPAPVQTSPAPPL